MTCVHPVVSRYIGINSNLFRDTEILKDSPCRRGGGCFKARVEDTGFLKALASKPAQE